MKIIFTGDLPGGELVCPTTGKSFQFKKGETIDVPEVTGKNALGSNLWKAAESATTTTTTTPKKEA